MVNEEHENSSRKTREHEYITAEMSGRCKISACCPKIWHGCHNLVSNWLLFVASSMLMDGRFGLETSNEDEKERPEQAVMRTQISRASILQN